MQHICIWLDNRTHTHISNKYLNKILQIFGGIRTDLLVMVFTASLLHNQSELWKDHIP